MSNTKTTSTAQNPVSITNTKQTPRPVDGNLQSPAVVDGDYPTARQSCSDALQKYYNEKWVAARLSISIKTLQSWRDKGCGPPFHKFGAAVRYRLYDIEKFERAALRHSTADTGNGADDA